MPLSTKHIDFLTPAPLRWVVCSLIHQNGLPVYTIQGKTAWIHATPQDAAINTSFSLSRPGAYDGALTLFMKAGGTLSGSMKEGKFAGYVARIGTAEFNGADLQLVLMRAVVFAFYGDQVPVPDDLHGKE